MDYNEKVKIMFGEYKGKTGTIEAYMAFTNIYVVNLDEGGQVVVKPNELARLSEEKGKEEVKKLKLELTQDEFDMLIEKLSWMRCIIRDSNSLNYQDYCNGDCNGFCNRPDLCNFARWLKSKIVA